MCFRFAVCACRSIIGDMWLCVCAMKYPFCLFVNYAGNMVKHQTSAAIVIHPKDV